jgi:hypothetical protein
MVGGWSPGPLMYLKSFLASRRCSVVEPHHLPMPPFPGTWCCHPKVLAMLIVLGVLMWLSFTSHSHILWNVSAILGSLIWFRLLALVVVRTSIQMSAQTCLDAIRQHDGKLILIGFSWGGAVGFRERKRGKCLCHESHYILVSVPLLCSSRFSRNSWPTERWEINH